MKDNLLPGNRIVRSRGDADALEKEGKCNYTIAGDLEITRLNLALFEGLNQLSAVDGNLTIHDNEELKNFEGLNNLASVGGERRHPRQQRSRRCQGTIFSPAQSVGTSDVSHNDKLTAVDGLIKLNAVGGNAAHRQQQPIGQYRRPVQPHHGRRQFHHRVQSLA